MHDINLIFIVYSLAQAQMVWEFANSPVKELGEKKSLFKRHRGANHSAGANITLCVCRSGVELSVGVKSACGPMKL